MAKVYRTTEREKEKVLNEKDSKQKKTENNSKSITFHCYDLCFRVKETKNITPFSVQFFFSFVSILFLASNFSFSLLFWLATYDRDISRQICLGGEKNARAPTYFFFFWIYEWENNKFRCKKIQISLNDFLNEDHQTTTSTNWSHTSTIDLGILIWKDLVQIFSPVVVDEIELDRNAIIGQFDFSIIEDNFV